MIVIVLKSLIELRDWAPWQMQWKTSVNKRAVTFGNDALAPQ